MGKQDGVPGFEVVDAHLLELALAAARDGVVICDARDRGMPLIYVNPAFEQMTGYDARFALGQNCRFLQGDDLAGHMAKGALV